MLIEGFKFNLSENEVCKTAKDSMHKSVVDVIDNNLGSYIFNKPFYAFYKDISDSKNAQDFKVLAKTFYDDDTLISFARHLIKQTGIRYELSYVHTPDDEKFYIVHEDDFIKF